MIKIKQLPKNARPREKAIRYGIDSLSNEELLAILIRTGTKDESALDIAYKISHGNYGLNNLFQMTYESLLDIKGIGPSKALILSSCFELNRRYQTSLFGDKDKINTNDICHRYIDKLINEQNEIVILIILNKRKEIIYEEEIYSGGEDFVHYSPESIVKKVILHNGYGFYLIHNHPSGNPRPSDNDYYATNEIIRLSNRVGIKLIDHIIIGKSGYYSMKEIKECQNNA